ncbi:MAG: EamA family transporter [Anaerolineae bacterium]
MRKNQFLQPAGAWLVTGAAVMWGTIGVTTQAIYTLDSTSSLFINLARMLIATPVLFLFCWRSLGPRMFHNIRRRDLMLMLLSGTFLVFSQASYFAAIRYVGVTIATLLTLCVAPLLVTLLSVLLRLETLTARAVIALICALAGAVLLVGLQTPTGAEANLLLGTVFAMLAAITYACMLLCGRFLAAEYHPLQVNVIAFSAGTVVLVVLNLLGNVTVTHTAGGWLLLVYLGLVPTALAYWLFQMGLRSVPATAASIMMMLDPVVAALLAWLLFGEALAVTGIAGAGLLLFSILLLTLDHRKGTALPASAS